MSDDFVIYPTGTCFDDALEFLCDVVTAMPGEVDRFRLVHAICLMPETQDNAGERFAHAWVEEAGTADGVIAWSFGIWRGVRVRYAVGRDDKYAHLRPQDVTYYTAEEAWRENVAARHYGPWRPAYAALVKPSQHSRVIPAPASNLEKAQ